MARPEHVYPATPPGVVEIKEIPATQAYEARAEADLFRARNELFRRDFAYLQANDLEMTIPVEGNVDPGTMRFFVPHGEHPGTPVNGVSLLDRPERTVVSAGLRGRYTRARYEDGVSRIRDWLDANAQWRPRGDPYVVYWNSPMMPWFLRRSEVHQEIVGAEVAEVAEVRTEATEVTEEPQ